MLDDHSLRELEKAKEQFSSRLDQLDRLVNDAYLQYEGPTVRHGPIGGDGGAAYENWKRAQANYLKTTEMADQKRKEVYEEWNSLEARYGLPPRFTE